MTADDSVQPGQGLSGPADREGNPAWWWSALCVLLGLSAFQIFYGLGVPTLWLDEVAAPLNARYSYAYLLELTRRLEEHPPLFYMASKLFMGLGDGDFQIRLFPALCGLACTLMIALSGRRLFGAAGGLMAASLWVASPHVLLLSRTARPYIVLLLMVLVSFRVLLACLESRSVWKYACLLLVNAVMLLVHYVGAFIICAQIASLIVHRRLRGGRVVDWSLALLCLGSLVTAGAVYVLLIRTSLTPNAILAATPSLGEVLADFARNVSDCVSFFPSAPVGAGILLLACAGMAFGAGNRGYGAVLAINAFGAASLLFALQKTSGLYPRHFSYMLVFLCLGLAQGAVRLFPDRRTCALVALGVAVAGVGAHLTVWRKSFYEEASYKIPVIGDNYRLLAREAAARLRPDEILNFPNPFYGNAVSFHLDRLAAECQAGTDASPACARPEGFPLASRMRLGPEDRTAHLALLMNVHPGTFPRSRQAFEERYGPLDVYEGIDHSTLFRMRVAREPLHALEPFPAFFRSPMDYAAFYRHVGEARDIAFSQNARGPAVVAARNDAEGVAGYLFENRPGSGPQTVFVLMEFENTGEDNLLWLEYAFDDEAPRRMLISKGYDVARQVLQEIRRETGYKRLALRAVLQCARKEPSLDGTNLATLRFKGLTCTACPAGMEQQCREAAMAGYGRSRLANYTTEDFPHASRVGQSVAMEGRNLVSVTEGDRPDWAMFVPADQTQNAEVRLRVRLDKDRLAFFPRLGNDSWLKVETKDRSGATVTLFSLANATDAWTPVGGRYEVSIPQNLRGTEQEVVITLRGRWAQLWHKKGVVFF